jgi:hypothetical protein
MLRSHPIVRQASTMPRGITLKPETAPLSGNGAEDEKQRNQVSTSINELRALALKSTYCPLSDTL